MGDNLRSSPSPSDINSNSSEADASCYGPAHTLELEEFDKPKEYLYSHTYYNVPLGLHLKRGRYAIVRKLGWGSFGTVWLARDRKEKTFVAVKILSSESTTECDNGTGEELRNMAQLIALNDQKDQTPSWRRHVVRCVDIFRDRSNEVDHACIVMEPLALSLDNLKYHLEGQRFPTPTSKSVIRQLLVALDGLHQDLGIVFTGTLKGMNIRAALPLLTGLREDLKPNNVLIRPANTHELIIETLITEPNQTLTESEEDYPEGLIRVVSRPLLPWKEGAHPLEDGPLEVVLVDFGAGELINRRCCRKPDHVFPEDAQHMAYRAPEVYLGYPATGALDIWVIGCLAFWLVSGGHVFEPPFFGGGCPGDDGWTAEEEQLGVMLERLSYTEFSIEMREKSQYWGQYLDEQGETLRFGGNLEPWSLERLMRLYHEDMPSIEAEGWLAFIRRCLRYQPELRPTAAELLQDPWLHED